MLHLKKTETRTAEEIERDEQHVAILGAIDSAKNELVEIGAAKKRVAAESEALNETLTPLRAEKIGLESSIAGLKAKFEAAQAEYDHWIKDHEAKKAEMTASLPDHAASLAELEEKKAPIQAEISRLSGIQIDSQNSLAEWNDKVTAAHSELAKLTTDIEAAQVSLSGAHDGSLDSQIRIKMAKLDTLNAKVTEAENLAFGIDNRREILSTVNKTIENCETTLVTLKNEIVKAQEQLKATQESSAKTNAETDQKIKGLAILEGRVDAKLETLKQYKEKFTVDELAKMKVSPDIT